MYATKTKGANEMATKVVSTRWLGRLVLALLALGGAGACRGSISIGPWSRAPLPRGQPRNAVFCQTAAECKKVIPTFPEPEVAPRVVTDGQKRSYATGAAVSEAAPGKPNSTGIYIRKSDPARLEGNNYCFFGRDPTQPRYCPEVFLNSDLGGVELQFRDADNPTHVYTVPVIAKIEGDSNADVNLREIYVENELPGARLFIHYETSAYPLGPKTPVKDPFTAQNTLRLYVRGPDLPAEQVDPGPALGSGHPHAKVAGGGAPSGAAINPASSVAESYGYELKIEPWSDLLPPEDNSSGKPTDTTPTRYRVEYRLVNWNNGPSGPIDNAGTWTHHCSTLDGEIPMLAGDGSETTGLKTTRRPSSFLAGTAINGRSARLEQVSGRAAVTMSCQTGAVDTCRVWGYAPGSTDANNRYGACLQAKRAAYFVEKEDMTSYTNNGICIYLKDAAQVSGDPITKYNLEANWGPDGATCMTNNLRKDLPFGITPLRECGEPLSSGILATAPTGNTTCHPQASGNTSKTQKPTKLGRAWWEGGGLGVDERPVSPDFSRRSGRDEAAAHEALGRSGEGGADRRRPARAHLAGAPRYTSAGAESEPLVAAGVVVPGEERLEPGARASRRRSGRGRRAGP